MQPRIKLGLIAGFIGIAIELLLFIVSYFFIFFNLIIETENEDYNFIGFGLISTFLIGCVVSGYFSAEQEKTTTRFGGTKVGALTGAIAGVIIAFPTIVGMFLLIIILQQISGSATLAFNIGNPKTTLCGLSIIIPIVIGSFLGAIGGFMAFPYTRFR